MSGPPCPRCRRHLPLDEVLLAATAKYGARVTCACGAVIEETWQSRLASVGVAALGLLTLTFALEGLPFWALVPVGLAAWFGAHLALLPIRRWRAVWR